MTQSATPTRVLVLTTFDWVPEQARGYVRDLRVRWALEEAVLPYRIGTVPIDNKGPEHFARGDAARAAAAG